MTFNMNPILEAHRFIQDSLPPVLEYLKDTSQPIDARWDAYTKLVENHLLVDEESFGDGHLSEVFGSSNVSLYDDFNMDRGQTRTYVEIWMAMNDEDFEAADRYDKAKFDDWREIILASGHSGFQHDW